jgi:hypothetical protein
MAKFNMSSAKGIVSIRTKWGICVKEDRVFSKFQKPDHSFKGESPGLPV